MDTKHKYLITIVESGFETFIKALDGNLIVGSCELLIPSSYAKCLTLSALRVEPDYRRQGIATRLVSIAESVAKSYYGAESIYLVVVQEKTNVIALYRKLGYIDSPEQRKPHMLEMEKSLK